MDIVEQLWSIEQIKNLKAKYFRLLDTKQWAEFRRLFTDDCKFSSDSVDASNARYQNSDAFVQWASSTFETNRVISVHHGHMPEIEITGERTAKGTWAMFDWVDHPTKQAFHGYGYYHEEYERGEDNQWRIKSRRLERLRVDKVPHTEEMPD